MRTQRLTASCVPKLVCASTGSCQHICAMKPLDLTVPTLPLRTLAVLDVSAASGIVARGDRLYVIADDELQLAVYDRAGVRQSSVVLLPGQLPESASERKAQKPDFEVLIDCPDGTLLALGSGSAPGRWRGAWVQPQRASVDVRAIDARELYAALSGELPELNLEGGAVLGDTLFLLSRGNGAQRDNALIRLDWGQVLRDLQQRARLSPEALRDIRHVALPQLGDQPLGFTDLALAGDQLVFCAAAEASANTYEDGACAGSALGVLTPDGVAHSCIAVSPLVKLEGICALSAPPSLQLLLVADADDRAKRAPLMAAEWRIA
jgi:hypothetical protein